MCCRSEEDESIGVKLLVALRAAAPVQHNTAVNRAKAVSAAFVCDRRSAQEKQPVLSFEASER